MFKSQYIALIVLTMLAAPATADTLYTGAWSHHVNSGDFNSENRLLAYHHEDSGLWGGYFRTSFDDDAFFLAHQWSANLGGGLQAGASLGVVHGYRDCAKFNNRGRKKVCVMATVSLQARIDWARPTAFVLGRALAFSPGWRLWP